jgi:uncharacterized coiled-coil protein SlyX
MTPQERLEERLIEIEQKLSHQDFAMEQAQETLHEQGLLIAQLEITIKKLSDRLNEAAGAANQVGPGDEKPPHY